MKTSHLAGKTIADNYNFIEPLKLHSNIGLPFHGLTLPAIMKNCYNNIFNH